MKNEKNEKNEEKLCDNDPLPLISICAVAYNHGAFIREALDHFLMQQGPFRIEILIHDDASTDGTAEVIREYKKRYPEIIQPILQTENQYSSGITNLSGAFNFPRVKGKYVALMDCDDYWISKDKLATQLSYMEAHPDCQLCVHSAEVRNDRGELVNQNLMRPYRGDRDLGPGELVDKAGSFPFGSMMLRAELIKALPDWYVSCPVGDRPLELMAAAKGYCHYIDRAMSVYRFNGVGSWTNEMKQGDYKKKQEKYAEQMREIYRGFDRETGGRYQREERSASRRVYFLTRVNLRDFSVIYDGKYRKYYRELSFRDRFFIRFEWLFPGVYSALRGLGLVRIFLHVMHGFTHFIQKMLISGKESG